jgi:penicillin-binding protein 2
VSRRRRFVSLQAPIEDEGLSTGRLGVFSGVVGLIFAILLSRLWVLQIVRGEDLRALAEDNRSHQSRVLAPRGVIQDAQGRALVTNSAQLTVYLHPDDVPHSPRKPKAKPRRKNQKPEPPPPDPITEAYFDRVCQLISIKRDELDKTIKAKKGRPGDPIPLLQGIDRHLLATIYEHADIVPGISVEIEPIRQIRWPVAPPT